jgi:adenine-specific DNA-methyltransferase
LSELLAGKGTHHDADGTLKTAGIFIGPEFGTVTRVDLVEAARECADAGFNVLISCAFNYEAQSINSDTSVPFAKPSTGRIAVKVINHLGDEMIKVYKVQT